MYACPIEMKDVRYNAATQSFEAAVTVHDNTTVRTYACTIEAPLSMSFEDAAKGLGKQAIRRHQSRGGLFSQADRFAYRGRAQHRGFNPRRWLNDLVRVSGSQAA